MKHLVFILLLATTVSNAVVEKEFVTSRFRESVSLTAAHKYYLSVSNVKYNSKVKALQMTTRFFIDDLEDVLSAREDRKITLGNPKELQAMKPVFERYLSKKLEVFVDGKSAAHQFLGAEYENDQIVFYTEIPAATRPQQVAMEFTALMELFEDQKNMVHLKINGMRKTLLMTFDKKKDSVKF